MIDPEVLGAVTADDVESLISRVAAGQSGLMGEAMSLVQEAARRELWRPDGCLKLSDWVAQRFTLSAREAGRWCRVAKALGTLGEFHAALSAGELGWAKVVALVEICQDADAQSLHLRRAAASTVDALEAEARRWRRERRNRDVERQLGRERNSLKMVPDPDHGIVRFWGHMAQDDAPKFQNFIEHTAKNECGAPAGEVLDPWDVRCGDALAMAISASLGGISRDRATINVHLDEEAAATGGRWGEMSMKPPCDYPVSTSLLERLWCDGRLRAVVEGADGSVLRFSDAEHPPPAIEQAVLRRDVHCVIRGCRAAHGEIHHIVWRSRGGATVMGNLVFVCWRHHRMIHHDGWKLTGTADALSWACPDGTVLWTTGPPRLAA